jgi:hypothetical protein
VIAHDYITQWSIRAPWPERQQVEQAHFICTAPADEGGEIRVKIEINIAETESFLPRIIRPYAVDSRWWSGRADVNTFQIEELMSTKLRAAADLLMERLGTHLKNAPSSADIINGAWRK